MNTNENAERRALDERTDRERAVRVGAIVPAAIAATAGLAERIVDGTVRQALSADAPVPLSDDRSTVLRLQNFAVKSEVVNDPDFTGELRILLTYNGRQWYPTTLAPHEAQLLVDRLVASFRLTVGGAQ